MERNHNHNTLSIPVQQNASGKPALRPKPLLAVQKHPEEHEVKLESPERTGSPGDETSRYVALITPATFNLGLKSPNGKKLFAMDVEEKNVMNNNNNNNNNNEAQDLVVNEEALRQLDDKILIESYEKKLDESYRQLEAAFEDTDTDEDGDTSRELEPDSLEDIVIRVPDVANTVQEDEPADIVLSPRKDYSDDEDEAPKKQLVVPKIVLDRVDADGTIVNYTAEEVPNQDTLVSNIQITLNKDHEISVRIGAPPTIDQSLPSEPQREPDEGPVQESTLQEPDEVKPVVLKFVAETIVSSSLESEGISMGRIPRKLFPQGDEEDNDGEGDEPVLTVKDLEARKLRALERERRRIIDNQVVRRKKIDYWAFANTSPREFTEDQLVALAHEQGGFEALAQVETAEESAVTNQTPPPTPPPPPPRATLVFDDEPEITEEPQLEEVEFPAIRQEDDEELLRSALMTGDGFLIYDDDGLPSLGAVDSASILENKERLRVFWEQRIMADQELKENGVSPATTTLVSLEGEKIEGTPTRAKSQEDIFKEAAVLEDCEPSPPDSLNEEGTPEVSTATTNGLPVDEVVPEVVTEKTEETIATAPELEAKVLGVDEGEDKTEVETSPEIEMEESALDREVRLALEREEQLKREQEANKAAAAAAAAQAQLSPESEEQPEDFPVHHVALAPTVEVESEEEREETVSKSQEKVSQVQATVVNETTTTVVKESTVSDEQLVEIIQTGVAKVSSVITEPFNDEVVTVGEVIFIDNDGTSKPVEEMLPANKPQIIGETYRQVVKEEKVVVATEATIVVGQAAVPTTNGSTPTTPLGSNELTNGGTTTFPKGERPAYNPNSDTKIALEIREMKEREEELRIMREAILRENQNNAANKASVGSLSSLSNSSRQSEQGSVHSDEGNEQPKLINGQNGTSSPVQTPIARTISLDNLHPGQAYNIGYAFGHRRKDGIKVKPLADSEEDKRVFQVLKESPIEKEIRLTKEREEELKREKGLIQESAQRPQTLDVTSKTVESKVIEKEEPNYSPITANGKLPTSKTSPFQVPLKTVGASGDTQRILATSRIQQEIEEQTEREKALRASGKIQTISQERTDAKVAATRLREVNGGSPDSAVALSSSGHTPLSPSPSLSDSEKSSTNSTPAVATNGVYTNGINTKSPSPTNSTVSGGAKVNGNFQVGRRFSNPPNGRNVSMQRFIASKGKEVVSAFSPFNSSSKEKSHSVLSLHHVNGSAIDAYQTKPPKVPKDSKNGIANNAISPATGLPKRSLTAETKIQEELKEMQAREAELRQQRARLLGLSQPNLSLLEDEDTTDSVPEPTNGHAHLQSNGTNGVQKLERANSNPNLLDDNVEFVGRNKKNTNYGGPRRRSTLIEQWEQRIQSSEANS